MRQQLRERGAPLRIVGDTGHGLSRRFAIQPRSIFFDALHTRQTRTDRRLSYDALAQRVDGHDAQTRRLRAQVPTAFPVVGEHRTRIVMGRSAERIIRAQFAGKL